MTRFWPLLLAAALVVAGVSLVAVPAGLIVAGVVIALLFWLLEEVGPDAKD